MGPRVDPNRRLALGRYLQLWPGTIAFLLSYQHRRLERNKANLVLLLAAIHGCSFVRSLPSSPDARSSCLTRKLSYITSILGFKLSLLFSYLRFITTGPFRIICLAVIVLCTMFHLSFLLVQINLCQPVRALSAANRSGHPEMANEKPRLRSNGTRLSRTAHAFRACHSTPAWRL